MLDTQRVVTFEDFIARLDDASGPEASGTLMHLMKNHLSLHEKSQYRLTEVAKHINFDLEHLYLFSRKWNSSYSVGDEHFMVDLEAISPMAHLAVRCGHLWSFSEGPDDPQGQYDSIFSASLRKVYEAGPAVVEHFTMLVNMRGEEKYGGWSRVINTELAEIAETAVLL